MRTVVVCSRGLLGCRLPRRPVIAVPSTVVCRLVLPADEKAAINNCVRDVELVVECYQQRTKRAFCWCPQFQARCGPHIDCKRPFGNHVRAFAVLLPFLWCCCPARSRESCMNRAARRRSIVVDPCWCLLCCRRAASSIASSCRVILCCHGAVVVPSCAVCRRATMPSSCRVMSCDNVVRAAVPLCRRAVIVLSSEHNIIFCRSSPAQKNSTSQRTLS